MLIAGKRGTGVMTGLLVLISSVSAFAAAAATKPEVALKKAFPQVPFESIVPSEIKGLYEVVSGGNIFYYYPEKDLIIVGDMYSKDQTNLTAARRSELAMKQVKDLPLDKAVKVGSGKNVVIEFTDPDCPYCRKASDFLRGRTDMTRYVFFAPLAHPAAITKIQYILNSEDKEKAYEEMMMGKTPDLPKAGFSDAIKNLAQEHLNLAKKVGVNGTPTFFINGQQVVGADTKKIEQLLKEAEDKKQEPAK